MNCDWCKELITKEEEGHIIHECSSVYHANCYVEMVATEEYDYFGDDWNEEYQDDCDWE